MKTIVFIANSAYELLLQTLQSKYDVILIPKVASLYEGIQNHADLHLHIMKDQLILSKEVYPLIKKDLDTYSLTYKITSKPLGTTYPDTARLNGLSTTKHFIHNQAITDNTLSTIVEDHHLNKVHVNQGYVRCTTLPLTDDTFITCDHGINKELKKHNFDTTLIQQGHIHLQGHDYGFIGGTAGRVEDTLYFNGDITRHPDYEVIRRKCESLGLKIWYVEGEPLVDIGSILAYYKKIIQ